MQIKLNQKGFTLVEIAIVLLIVTILLGYSVAMLPVQQELKQYRQVENEMKDIVDHLIAFAQVNGRLPCAADATGLADPDTGLDCNTWYGFLPGKTLGIDGSYDNNLLVDPWGTPYRYQVTSSDFDGDGNGDFVMAIGGIQAIGIADLAPDLVLCTTNPSALATDTACASPAQTAAGNIPAVVLSFGKNGGTLPPSSAIEGENTDNTADGTTDIVFVKGSRSDSFDDIVKWISPNLLFSKMIEADQLP